MFQVYARCEMLQPQLPQAGGRSGQAWSDEQIEDEGAEDGHGTAQGDAVREAVVAS
jgi:hypothetical protein